ncbi:single-stranded DNA-binding protein [Phaeobacter inhibens]|uniref:single-stranded DNA-binding protein n=1 Tax=Phaeobacter inhibens TaxID=221822 RepID=UPI0021A5C6FE|nr:single-stranded DNA-binding protein [Phaeobacter inhibens]UWR62776.1 single-stranded DNA-binding protein [Phaeobacter inhibens]
MFQFAEFTIQGYVGKVTITGNVMRLNIGATKSWKDRETGQRNEKTKWNTVTVFENNPGFIWLKGNLKKGDLVHVRGEMENTSYDKAGETVYDVSLIADTVAVIPTGKHAGGE